MLLALCLFAFGLAQLDAPYPSWMRESDNELRREEEEVGMMPASPLKETRLWGLEQRKREAAAAAVGDFFGLGLFVLFFSFCFLSGHVQSPACCSRAKRSEPSYQHHQLR